VIARALAKSPADRFPSCRELVRAARDALGARPPTAAEGRVATDDSPTVPSSAPLATPATAEELVSPGAGRRRRALALIAIVAAVAAAAVVLGIVLTQGGSDPGGTTEATPAASASAPGTTASAVDPATTAEEPSTTVVAPPSTPAGAFVIELEDVVSPGEPSEGAGEIAEPGEMDVFALDAGAGEQIFLDVQPIEGECPPRGMRWKLEHAEGGTEVFDEPLFDCAEPFDEDGFTLEEGTYVLTVYGTDGVTGTYRFLPAPVVLEEFTLALGDVVEPGEPGEGAGEIAEPGQLDVFTFDAAGGETIFLDVQPIGDQCPVFDMGWKLEHLESGSEVFDEAIYDCAEPFTEEGFTLEEGTYALVVYGAGGVTGTYRFHLEEL
jgi:hypothetical protein